MSCIVTPWRIAFADLSIDEPIEWLAINYSIDCFFFVDILVIFNSSYHDDDFNIVEDRKQIAKQYLQGWFTLDLLAIMPFDVLIQSGSDNNFQDFARIIRLGRMSKLIKMMRLLRILKIVKERSKLLKYLNEILKIGLGFERLVFFIIIFFIMAHFLTCIWVISTQFTGSIIQTDDGFTTMNFEGTWMELGDDIP
jgi:hypothetical protein